MILLETRRLLHLGLPGAQSLAAFCLNIYGFMGTTAGLTCGPSLGFNHRFTCLTVWAGRPVYTARMPPAAAQSILHVRVILSGRPQPLCAGMHSHAGLQALGAAAAVIVLLLHSHTGRPIRAVARYTGQVL
jgi:hypothetical protein